MGNKNLLYIGLGLALVGGYLLYKKGGFSSGNSFNKREALINFVSSDKDKEAFKKMSNADINIAYEKLIKNNTSVNAEWQKILTKYAF